MQALKDDIESMRLFVHCNSYVICQRIYMIQNLAGLFLWLMYKTSYSVIIIIYNNETIISFLLRNVLYQL